MSKQLSNAILWLVLALMGFGAKLSVAAPRLSEQQRSHWAFQPIRRPDLPSGKGTENPIDQFISSRLESAGLGFSPMASRAVLIRRVTVDLIGLPPAKSEIEAFENDLAPDAYERLIDRLLASPHYGERWGRHWLDLARFAETDGFEHDAVRPHSWRYRDYVVESFNQDKPFDRFIREQIAGDELWPGDPVALTATGFNLLGPDMVDSSDQVQRRHNTLNDMTDTLGLSFLGLTIGCARCHDHKFEPLSQRDYYKLQAFFASAKFEREQPVPTKEERAAYDEALKRYESEPAVRELGDFEGPFRKEIFEKKVAVLSPEAQSAHRTSAAQRTAEQSNLVLETLDKVKITEADLNGALSKAEKERRESLLQAVKRVQKPGTLPKAMSLIDGLPTETHILRRGDYNQPLEQVSPGVPEVLELVTPRKFKTRAELANWLVSADNPLTARVMVNRIWQHHFGRGLVATPSDFGIKGEKPTHPELLDWLASEFSAKGWSVKQMHRLILTSITYRQSSDHLASAAERDPDNKLYWRMNRIRVQGEVIRDSLLAISDRLNPQFAGPGVLPPIPRELFTGAAGWTATKNESDINRRSIYIFARRNLRFPFLEVFDAPDSNLSCPARDRSTTAPQSLTLLNSDEVMTSASATAGQIGRIATSPEEQIQLCYERILGRSPSQQEIAMSKDFLAGAPLSEFCRALFNVSDFLFVQ